MTFDYALIGGQTAGGDKEVFGKKAKEVQLGEFSGQGFLVVDPIDPFKRRFGHARLGVEAADTIALNFLKKGLDGNPLRWKFRGTVYREDLQLVEELEVYIVSYSFSDTVHLALQEVPRAR